MSTSVRTVKRAVAQLRQDGVLSTEVRRDEAGVILGTDYILLGSPGATAGPLSSKGQTQGTNLAPVYKEELDPVQLDLTKNTRTAAPQSRSEDVVPPPGPGTLFTGYPPGQGPPSRTAAKRAKLHQGHAYCDPIYCVTAALHEKNLQRMRAAGLNLDDFKVDDWYRDSIAAMAEEGTSEPGLWLYKRLTSAIEVSVREG